jgi:magnesium transporter
MLKVAKIMHPPALVLRPGQTAGEALALVKAVPRERLLTYPMVADRRGKLVGVCTLRDLLAADPKERVGDLMLKSFVSLHRSQTLERACDAIRGLEIPEYPVTGRRGILAGVVRAAQLNELQRARLESLPGRMVGITEEEMPATPVVRAIRLRLPWLLFNLLTAFAAGLVVATFQGTIDRLVLLASFLPVLAGQSGNTGGQALAIAIRGMSHERGAMPLNRTMAKELQLGLANGAVTGAVVAAVMYATARAQGSATPGLLAFVVFAAMILSCAVSGVSGTAVPALLKKFGFDPASASSIILTTVTDIVSMGAMLSLATWIVLGAMS